MGFYNHKVTFRYTVGHFGFAENVLLAMLYRNPKKNALSYSQALTSLWLNTLPGARHVGHFLDLFSWFSQPQQLECFPWCLCIQKLSRGLLDLQGHMKYVEHVY